MKAQTTSCTLSDFLDMFVLSLKGKSEKRADNFNTSYS
jgi:hypothetical protein